MPSVNKNETQQHYVSHCVKYIMDNEKGKSQKAALGQCYGMYKQYKKNKQSKGCLDCEPNFDDYIEENTFNKNGFDASIDIS